MVTRLAPALLLVDGVFFLATGFVALGHRFPIDRSPLFILAFAAALENRPGRSTR